MKLFTQQLKQRDFYKYECGREQALVKLDHVYSEIQDLETRIENFGYTATKFGNPNLIDGCNKQVDAIKTECGNMKMLWDHISTCQ